jgi:VanZ family protein
MNTHQKPWIKHLWFTFMQMSDVNKRAFAAFWTGLTALLSLIPPGEAGKFSIFHVQGIDKVGHGLFYLVMAFLWCLAMQSKGRSGVVVFIFCVSFGILMEFLQFYLFYGRQFEISDMIANAVGVVSGIVLYKTNIN